MKSVQEIDQQKPDKLCTTIDRGKFNTCNLPKNFFDCHMQSNDKFDREFYDWVMASYANIKAELREGNADHEEVYNKNISVEEVEVAILRLKLGEAPGPNTFPTDLFFLLLLTFCLSLLPLWESATVLCFVVRHLCPF